MIFFLVFSCFDDLSEYALGQSTDKAIINLYVWRQMSPAITIFAVLDYDQTCILKTIPSVLKVTI